jgi:hypothetical protein
MTNRRSIPGRARKSIARPRASYSLPISVAPRRFDETARILDRGDATILYNVGQFTFDGSFQTIQMDFNRRGGVNSPTPLNFVPGRTRPYYLYGNMNDLSWTYTFNTTYSFSPAASVFVEYAHEKYHKRMISRNRTPTSGTQTIETCGGCDTPNNDWESIARDIFDTYAGGLDLFISKRFWISPYYSLAAGKGNVFSRALGDPSVTSGPRTSSYSPAPQPQKTIHKPQHVSMKSRRYSNSRSQKT